MKKADLIIIGGGPGGYETAISAANAGLDTVLVEYKDLGGTCLNEGCIPTKCLCRTAEILDLCTKSEYFGVNCNDVNFSLIKAQERKQQVVETLKKGISTMLSSAKVRVVYGRAVFIDSKSISVIKEDQEEHSTSEDFTADNIIIATGSKTKYLPIKGANLSGVLTSKEMLSLEYIPQSLCIIGGGVIGMEFASVFSSFGSKVSVVEFCKEILPNFDTELSKRLRLAMKRKGVTFYTSSAVTEINQSDSNKSYLVSFDTNGNISTIECDTVLMAIGRTANLDSLNLNDIGIECDKRGIKVDENFQTSVSGIYAVGDVNGLCQLAHVAKYQGKKVLNHILDKVDNLNLEVIPAAVFTVPEFAMVGKSEDYCIANNIEYKVHKAFFRANGKALALGETEGLVKFVTTPSGKILGCHILGTHASDLIEEAAVVIQQEGSLNDISQVVHAHPTLCEIVCDAAMC